MDELLLGSSINNKPAAITLWDWKTGNILVQYKNGGPLTHHLLEQLGEDYFIGGNPKEPKLYLWQVNNPEPVKTFRLILPEVASCLGVCPQGYYLAAGIKTDLYVWQLASGKVLCIQQKNFQPITVIRFSSCGNYIVTGSQDGMVITYQFIDLNQTQFPQSNIGQTEPLYTKDHHNRPITDICIGSFGRQSRFASSSIDQTVKVYELFTGTLLLNLVFQNEIHCVIFDLSAWNFFAGGSNGILQTFNLTQPPREIDHHLSLNKSSSLNTFEGHNQTVKCLTLNSSGCILASGGDDNLILIWEVSSKQVLKKIELNSPITNLKFILNQKNIVSQDFKVAIALSNLERQLDLSDTKCNLSVIQTVVVKDPSENCLEEQKKIKEHLEYENKVLRARNQQLHAFALKCLKQKKT